LINIILFKMSDDENYSTESDTEYESDTETDTESDSGTDNEEKEEELDISEFELDLADLKNPEDNICLKCQKKFTNKHKIAVCKSCLYEIGIIKTNAKKIYGLKDADLADIDYYPYKNGYARGETHLYFLKEIRLKAIEKRFNIINPTIDVYANSVMMLLEEAKNRSIESKQRGEKIKATKERKRKERRKQLKDALAKKNLQIRDDSYYCQQFLDGHQFTLAEVVDMMEQMDFFATRTKYFSLLKKGRNQDREDRQYYCYEERRMMDEYNKEYAKQEAMDMYVREHGIAGIPKSIRDNFEIIPKKCQYCGKNANYILTLSFDVPCTHCNRCRYDKNEFELIICDPECPKMDWKLINHLQKHQKKSKIICCLEEDYCSKCKKNDNSVARFIAKKI